VKQTRGLWASIIFVLLLVTASLIGFATGTLKPKLGLDLEGGVSVILSAPQGTPQDVLNQALTNIRNRVDSFGVGEPQIFVSGNTIEVQIPGSANGTIEQRSKVQYCLIGADGTNYGCAADQASATKALSELTITPVPSKVCLKDASGTQLRCYSSQQDATTAQSGLTVAPKAAPSSSASPSASPSPSSQYCIVDTAGNELACYPSQAAAQAAQKGITSEIQANTYCVVAPAASPSPASPSPSISPSPSSKKASPSPSTSASPSPSTTPSAYSKLGRDGASDLPCGLRNKADAQTQLDGIAVSKESTQYCVISSAGQNQGCYVSQSAAQQRQKETGQERLLSVIGQTARLEQRPVLAILTPADASYASTPVTCATVVEQQTPKCSFDALANQEVVYLGKDRSTKYQLGPVVLSGDQITKASATLSGGTQSNPITQWTVNFQLNGEGSKAFADATQAALSAPPPQNQIAIVVDRKVISSPQVNGAITTGSGEITGGFSEQEAKDLATVLQAGALPVELTRQSVQTISPTLGQESLREGIIAGAVGLALLLLYLLFYYRLLGIVAWFGMTIWAILAIALVSLAGRWFGYALTLAGVAGLVISLGVTADSYIVFFERLKDEVRGGKSPRSAVQPAFKRAYRTIFAADTVTIIAALVLYITAVSSVRGFALTLGVATLLDLFVVYFFKRPTVFLIARNDTLVNMHGFGLTSGVAGEPEPGEESLGTEGV
jgi:preprotein translocase subunit SecD